MRVVLDSSMLLLFLRPDTPTPRNSEGLPDPPHAAERVAHLIDSLDEGGAAVIVPTPVLTEVLVGSPGEGIGPIVQRMHARAVFEITAFDEAAAIELADITRAELAKRGRMRLRDEAETKAKLNFDRQIVAIATVTAATRIYTQDTRMRTVARRRGLEVRRLADLPIPPDLLQMDLL